MECMGVIQFMQPSKGGMIDKPGINIVTPVLYNVCSPHLNFNL